MTAKGPIVADRCRSAWFKASARGSVILTELDTCEQPLLSSCRVIPPLPIFHYRNRALCCEEVDLEQLTQSIRTPCYIYSRRAILRNLERFRAAFQDLDPLVLYAVKANPNLTILGLLRDRGCGFEVVSGGELDRLRRVGADFGKVLFSGVGKTRAELELAIQLRLQAISVESDQELSCLLEMAETQPRPVPLSLRLNLDVAVDTHPYIATGQRQHKFGIDEASLPPILDKLAHTRQALLTTLSVHIGSQIMEAAPFQHAFSRLKKAADQLRHDGFPITRLSLGGGFGVSYRQQAEPDLAELGRFLQRERGDYSLIFEPGRYLTANSGALLTRVLYRKMNRGKHFVIVDAAMNDLLRPALYQAYHRVLPLREAPTVLEADLVGPVCESGDFLALDRPLPDLTQGEGLAILDTGAYGFVLASNYNSRPRAAEILVRGSETQLIRRRETLDDLVEAEFPEEKEVRPLPSPASE